MIVLVLNSQQKYTIENPPTIVNRQNICFYPTKYQKKQVYLKKIAILHAY